MKYFDTHTSSAMPYLESSSLVFSACAIRRQRQSQDNFNQDSKPSCNEGSVANQISLEGSDNHKNNFT